MYRIWYLVGAVVLWVVLYQGFFRYEYTTQNGYAVKRFDRLTGKTCGIPDCLSPTPTPVPIPTVFDPNRAYREAQVAFRHEARVAVSMVKKTEFGEELMHSPGAKKFSWTCQLADSTAGGIFELHDPKLKHHIPIDQQYIASLSDPKYKVDVVCFCDQTGAGYRWEVNLSTKKLEYVNDNPILEKKYGLVDAK
ncbi:MAG: hypothetical protein ACRENA_05595 [Vulcanimicrobiaceae bacterium]